MKFKAILAPIDFSDVTTRVVDHCGEMAKSFGGRVVLLNVTEPEPDFVGFEAGPQGVHVNPTRDFKVEHQQLETFKHRLVEAGVEVTVLHSQGPLADKILEEAAQLGADLIVMGSHGHGALYNLLVGSVTSGVIKGAKCPVLIVPARQEA